LQGVFCLILRGEGVNIKNGPEELEEYDEGVISKDILAQQRKRLNDLQDINRRFGKETPLLIKAKEGETPEGQDIRLYHWLYFKDIWSLLKKPIYTRGILKCEIVFDPDTPDYEAMRKGMQKLKDYLDLKGIPYELAYSGGKAVHLHIFIDTCDINPSDLEEAREKGIDLWKCTRETITKELLKNAGVDSEKIGLDWKKIRFTTTGSLGSMIREYGSTRSNGKYKTLVDKIPETNPDYLPIRFPSEAPKLWNISGTIYHEAVRKAIKAEIERARTRNEYNLEPLDFIGIDPMEFPCMQEIYSAGLKNGRYYATVAAVLLFKKCGYNRDDTEKRVREFVSSFVGLTPSEQDLRVKNALSAYDNNYHFSCRTLKDSIGEGFCNYSICPLKNKIDKVTRERKEAKVRDIVKKLHELDVPKGTLDKINLVKDFMYNNLQDMGLFERRAFSLSELRKHFGLKVGEMREILKQMDFKTDVGIDRYFTGEGKFIPSRVSEDIMKKINIVTMADTSEILVYDEKTGCYCPNGEHLVRKMVKDILGDLSIERYGNEVIYDISLSTMTQRTEFDKEDGCVNLQNGYYDIKNRQFFQHTPKKLFTKALPFTYDPHATCPHFDKFIESTGVDTVEIYEIFAFCLTNGYPIQAIIIFIGDGGNGKGTTLRVLISFLGECNVTAYSMQALSNDKYAIASLYGKLANICGDMSHITISDTSMVKSLSGNDLLNARHIYGKPFSFVNGAKLIFSMNQMPEIEDNTDSMFRRPKIIEFKNRVKGLDSNFSEDDLNTPEELAGIFNRAMDVLPELLKREELTGTMSIQETRNYIQNKSDSVSEFVNSCITIGTDDKTLVSEVYTAYTKRCIENGTTRVEISAFGKRLLQKFRDQIAKVPITSSGVRKNYYSGFVLNEGYKNLDSKIIEEEYVRKHENYDNRDSSAIATAIGRESDKTGSEAINVDDCYSNHPIFNEGEEKKQDASSIFSCKADKNGSKSIATMAKVAHDNENKCSATIAIAIVRPKVEGECAKWEKQNGPINSMNINRAVSDISKVMELPLEELKTLVAKHAKLLPEKKEDNTWCVGCGSNKAPNQSILSDGQLEHRCDKCYREYANKSVPTSNQSTEAIS